MLLCVLRVTAIVFVFDYLLFNVSIGLCYCWLSVCWLFWCWFVGFDWFDIPLIVLFWFYFMLWSWGLWFIIGTCYIGLLFNSSVWICCLGLGVLLVVLFILSTWVVWFWWVWLSDCLLVFWVCGSWLLVVCFCVCCNSVVIYFMLYYDYCVWLVFMLLWG